MWDSAYRERLWSAITQPWDLLVIGGGISGAGVLRQASLAGLNCLLVEATDFSSGTSSRSSKLVHGGFRYMRSRQFDVTRESVRERDWLLRTVPGLVTPLPFVMPNYQSYHTPAWQFRLGVALYDLFGMKWKHQSYSARQAAELVPQLNPNGLEAAFLYEDAAVDDSRLVLRVLQEAMQSGAHALNYARVECLLRDRLGQVCGALVRDTSRPDGPMVEVHAGVVIQATGPWTDELRQTLGAAPRIRQTRGSHLIFQRSRLPLQQAVTLMHPVDKRAMFAIPWEGVCLVGTTDLDHRQTGAEPFTSQEEMDYILEVIQAILPGCEISARDIMGSMSGVRPIVTSGAADPSAESRAHAVLEEHGLFSIAGGKLTTFRVMADSTLQAAHSHFSGRSFSHSRQTMFSPLKPVHVPAGLSPRQVGYLAGRHGANLPALFDCPEEELSPIASLPNLWAELRLAARSESVLHLDDLLLRRVRLGLQLPAGGQDCLPRIQSIVQSELGWSNSRWNQEAERYLRIWQNYYSPHPGEVPQEAEITAVSLTV